MKLFGDFLVRRMASPIGFEPTVYRLGGDCIIQLCYGEFSPQKHGRFDLL